MKGVERVRKGAPTLSYYSLPGHQEAEAAITLSLISDSWTPRGCIRPIGLHLYALCVPMMAGSSNPPTPTARKCDEELNMKTL